MNDSNPEVEIQVRSRILSPGLANSVIVTVDTKSEEIFINPTTGHQTRQYPRASPSFLVVINPRSSSPDDIQTLLHDQFVKYHWLCDHLAPKISTAAIDLGCGNNGFILTMFVTVLLRRIKAEELKSLKMETESCSICLENLTCPKPNELTRMPCSHVFHSQCLLEWLERKNTCPLCRTLDSAVLIEQSGSHALLLKKSFM